jgi:two-component system cell cycle sensor histidine kinase/response regulator CckA
MNEPAAATEDPEDEVTALVRKLHETQQRLQELAGGEVDAVLHPGGHSYLLHEAQEKLRRSEAAQRDSAVTQASILNALPAHIALLDEHGVILSVNDRWRLFAATNALQSSDFAVGQNYLLICAQARGDCSDEARAAAAGISSVLCGGHAEFGLEYPCHSPDEQRWFRLTVSPLVHNGARGVVVMHVDITERQRASALLIESRERLALATESARLGIWEWEVATNKLVWDAQMYALYGIREQDFSGAYEAWQSGVHPDDRQRSEAELFAAVEGANGFHTEFRVVWPSGEVRDIEAHAAMQRADHDSSRRMIGVNWDITERKRTERALRESEERFRQTSGQLAKVLDSSPDAICAFDAKGCFVQVSAACEKIWGYRPEELLGSPYIEKVLPEDQPKTRDAALAVMTGHPTRSFENRYVRKDGAVTHILWSAWWSEADQSMFCVARDDTDRQRTEKRIAEQAALIDEARDAIVVRDLAHRITFWSKGAERLYGWTAGEARGNLLNELLEIDDFRFAEAERMVRGIGAWNGEIEKTARNDAVLTLDSRWTLLRDPSGAPHSILSIDTDITERRKIEHQFLRAQRMESIGTLAGGIAHDLNNSLSPIIISLELLAAKFTDPESAELLEIIGTSARRGSDMVRQVLAFARGVEGERQELQVRHLVQDVEKIANDTFLKGIEVRTNLPNDLWTVLGDATQLHQVLLNLCVNARDAMPNGGKLFIGAENLILDAHYAGLNREAHPGNYIVLQVEDSGTGMSPEIIEKIFDPFVTTKEVGKGTGLGLSTSTAIVKSHGGFVRVYSEPGKGTTFKVYLPANADHLSADPVGRVVELPRGHGELILVVDDEPSVRLVTQQTLEAFGYRVLLAADGAEAVATYATRGAEIAVTLTDMRMPVMDGPATIQVLRKLNPKLPIIAASGLSAHDYAAKLASLGVQHFLPKPYTAETLLKALRVILEEKA